MPYHERLENYLKIRNRIFLETPTSRKRLRSKLRIRDFWQRRKQLRSVIVSSIVKNGIDSRPYVNVLILNRTILALLDSGANRSCIGGELAGEILSNGNLGYNKFRGNVKTADGHNQQVVGSIFVDLNYNNISRRIELLIVPNLKQNLICGIDFWKSFGIEIWYPNINEIILEEDDPDVLKLNSLQLLFPHLRKKVWAKLLLLSTLLTPEQQRL